MLTAARLAKANWPETTTTSDIAMAIVRQLLRPYHQR